jgi:hypothetical protein
LPCSLIDNTTDAHIAARPSTTVPGDRQALNGGFETTIALGIA